MLTKTQYADMPNNLDSLSVHYRLASSFRKLNLLFRQYDLQYTNPEINLEQSLEAVRLSQALQSDSLIVEAYFRLISAKIRLQNFTDAQRNLQIITDKTNELNYGIQKAKLAYLKGLTNGILGEVDLSIEDLKNGAEVLKGTIEPLLGEIYRHLALAYRNKNNLALSIEYYLEAHKVFKAANEVFMAQGVLNNISDLFGRGDVENASLQTQYSNLQTAIGANDSLHMAISLNHLGTTLRKIGKYNNARDYLLQANAIWKKINDPTGVASTYNELGITEFYVNNFDVAINYLNTGYKMGRNLKRPSLIATATLMLANCYIRKGNFVNAKQYLEQTISIRQQQNDKVGLAGSYNAMAEIALFYRDDELANEYLNKSLFYATSSRHLSELEKSYLLRSRMLRMQGKYAEAASELEKYISIHDSLAEVIVNKTTEAAVTAVEIEKEMRKNELLTATNKQQQEVIRKQKIANRLLIALIVSLIGLAFLLFILYRRYKQGLEVQAQNSKEIQLKTEEISEKNEELITQNNRLNELLQERGRFIALVSHDLKSPLSQIYSLAQLLQIDGENLNTEQVRFIEQIKNSVNHGVEMINDLLNVEAYEDKNFPLNIVQININDFLRDIAASFQTSARNKDIRLYSDFDIDDPAVYTDPKLLRRVVHNLLSNAIKFTEQGRRVFFNTRTGENGIVVSIRDEGPGIPPDEVKHLFTKFGKLSPRPTANESSTGLGLYMVKLLIQKLSSKVWVETELGKGTTFHIEIPQKKQ